MSQKIIVFLSLEQILDVHLIAALEVRRVLSLEREALKIHEVKRGL